MLYIELYLCDYLRAEDGIQGVELWGEQRGDHFYICHLRKNGERKPFSRAHMQYLGDCQGLENVGRGKVVLFYRREGELYRQEASVYVARETEQIEHFLLGESGSKKSAAGSIQRKESEKRTGGRIFPKVAACAALLFLTANMVEALSSYKNMQEVIEIVELLMK